VPYSPTDLEAFVRQRAPQIAVEIRDAACKACNEADLVAAVERIIERFAKNFDVTLNLGRERTLINGRADAVYNRFVIEYEPPNSLRKELSARPNQHAIGQVKQYMEGLERLERHKKERLAGAVLDGTFFIFVRYRDDHWHIDDPVPVEAHSTETFLRYLLSLSTELAVTPENLVRDFGENSNTARAVVPALYRALATTDSPKVQTLFRQWRRQFQEVTGYDASGGQLDAPALAKSYAVKDAQPNLERLFFAIHSYYATFIKLLALQVAHYYLMPKVGTGLAAAANYDADKLRGYLAKMERGGLLAELGIRNFLEGDFFGWFLDAWDEGVEKAVRRLIGDLANYSLVTLDVDPEETRDLLKRLYQNLMPKKLRHALGEYYTPDWLAERLLNQLGYDGNPKWRLLDPACGSGTFLVLAIKRVKRYAEEKGLNEADVLDMILHNIVGFDLNPLAVSSARTNYLLALGDLLQHRRGEISIPVYLADSILTPSQGTDLFGHTGFSFNTAVGKFTVPQALVDARYIDPLADLLEESVTAGLTPDLFRQRLLHTFPLTDTPADDDEVDLAVLLYEQLAELERQGINGIWARIIKNAFAPLFVGRFDFVAGNPPWVNWANLPADYRQESAPLWQEYNLFPHTGLKARLGGAMDDISVLMFYVAADKYLKAGAKLGFVITQTLFKTEGGGAGFRHLKLGPREPLKVLFLDDLSELQVFEGATNRTAVVVVQKGRPTTYPVRVFSWRKQTKGASLPTDASLEEAIKLTKRLQWIGEPVSDENPTSPWIMGRERAVDGVRKCIGESPYQARYGTHTHANGIFWLDVVTQRPDELLIVQNLPNLAKKDIETVQTAIEGRFVHPLLRGKDVDRWAMQPVYRILVPQDTDQLSKAYPEHKLAVEYPKTFAYLKHFEADLRARSGYRQFFDPQKDPFYSIYNVGDYTFAQYKVAWREVATDIRAAVIDSETQDQKAVVPDHTLVFVAASSAAEAHFICALLNSSPAGFVVRGYIAMHPSTHVLKYVAIPRYDPNALLSHRALSDLSQQAHAATAAGDAARVRRIEAKVDQMAARLWGLTDAELQEIQESLAELG